MHWKRRQELDKLNKEKQLLLHLRQESATKADPQPKNGQSRLDSIQTSTDKAAGEGQDDLEAIVKH